MGKKRFNERGRQKVETIIDNSELKKIQVELDAVNEYQTNDTSNLLVLPSEKRKTKIKKTTTVTRILSKKQRKHLEKIVEKKKKKEQRADLLEALSTVQIPKEQLNQLTSLTSIQTKGLKKLFHEQKYGVSSSAKLRSNNIVDFDAKVNTIAGIKRKNLDESDDEDSVKKPRDYNVIGLNDSSSSESEEDEEIAGEESEASEIEAENQEKEIDSDSEETTEKIEEVDEKPMEIPEKPMEIDEKSGKSKETKDEKPIERKPAVYIHVERDADIQIARLKLPILAEEQIIMETISENSVIILAGETGSGKTTQVPQFLYEAGYAENGKIIAITEPRRVAAISMSKRVAHEMNLGQDIVSYLIRFEGNCTERTKVKFMTDGVLLKEIECDFMLSKYSVIILDEAHERSAYTDILIGLLSRIVLLRNKKGNPLKLIIMSATLRVEDFTSNKKLFKISPPVIKVDSRQFPVTIHFNKVTEPDYVKEAFLKTVKIHSKLPEGGILVFVTGQQEVKYLVKKLRSLFPYVGKREKAKEKKEETTEETQILDYSDDEELDKIFNIKKAIKQSKKNKKKFVAQISLPKVNLDDYQLPGDDTEADFNEEGNDDLDADELDETDERISEILNTSATAQPLWVLPLYSLLPSYKQARVFEAPPEGARLCVIATNVAETSLTIPDVKYVVDSGRQKTKFYDKVTGMSAFVVTYTSKSAANQRAGRAGRVAPGHCYRLYSSAVYNDEFVDFSPPEIQEKPVEGLMLQMKCMGIDKVLNFPFPSPPDKLQLSMAEKRLKVLGALEDVYLKSNETTTKVTKLGSSIAAFPVAPRFGKMLALSHQENLLEYTVCLVAALSVQEVLQEIPLSSEAGDQDSKWRQKRKMWAGTQNSLLLGDPMILLKAVGAAEYAHSQGKLQEFCEENGLRLKAIVEIRKLRIQLTNEINLNVPSLNLCVNPKMTPPSDQQAKLLRQILLSGLGDQVARKIPEEEIKMKEDKHKYKYAYQIPDMEAPIIMHSCSVLKKKQPEFVCYQEIYETKQADSSKMFLRGITAIEPEWLVKFAPKVCNIEKILDEPIPKYNFEEDKILCHVKATFGRSAWPLPLAEMEMPDTVDKYKYFSMFFLNGEICVILENFKKNLLSSPDAMCKAWSKLVPRTQSLLNAFKNRQIDSRKKLMEEWKKDPKYLLQQYLEWIPESLHSKVTSQWPPTKA